MTAGSGQYGFAACLRLSQHRLALVTCMRKLLTILNAMVRDNKPFRLAAHGLSEGA